MNKKYLTVFAIVGIALFSVIVVIAVYSSQNKNCDLIENQKNKDSCYHALAHGTDNKDICNKSSDSELKEHCLVHIPGD